MSTIIFDFELRYTVVETHAIELPDDYEELKALYEVVGWVAPSAPKEEAIAEMQADLAREFVHGPASKFLGVDMVQDENSEMYVSRRTTPVEHLVAPAVWSRILRAIVLLDPLDQLAAVLTPEKEEAGHTNC